MDETTSQKEEPKEDRKFSQEQFEMLLRCSKKGDMTEWNEWRKANPSEEILLEGAYLGEANLEGASLVRANLEGAEVRGASLQGANLREANLKGADLREANLEGADLREAKLEGAELFEASLQGANLCKANLEGADLVGANLEGADLSGANLEGADLVQANLERADLGVANLQGADLVQANLHGAKVWGANLEGAHLLRANLQGADCSWAEVNGSTIIAGCIVDRDTDFLGVGLGSARIEPELRQLLECSIRRRKWEQWYKVGPFFKKAGGRGAFLKQPVRWFWWMCDYGRLTGRIIGVFFVLAIVFAAVYYLSGLGGAHCIVDNLFADKRCVEVAPLLVPFRAFYFSVVTMTTLGFGDMHANAHSFWGHLLLTVQVLLGYVLLAALVTRFAILFTAGGPAGKFPKKSKQVDTPKTNRSG